MYVRTHALYLCHAFDEGWSSTLWGLQNKRLKLFEMSINQSEVREEETLEVLNVRFTELTQTEDHSNTVLLFAMRWLRKRNETL